MPGCEDVFEEDFRVLYSDVDFKGQIKAVKILNLCQDIASRHSYQLGLSALHLGEKGKIWVVHRYELEFKKRPFWDEVFKIRTWRYPFKKLYEMRRFDFLDSNNDVFVKGLCSWVIVDKKTKRPSRLDRTIEEKFCFEPKNPEVFAAEIKSPLNPVLKSEFKALRDDIDFNNHVNNTSYLKWAKECIDEDDFKNKNLKKIEILYLNDSLYNDRLKVFSEKEEDSSRYLIEIKNGKNLKSLALIKIFIS
ncbi:MAG: thioesterase [Desulforegulaceae bacterium]|nr:thioesterase [Desulforegulaceae bacterium]